MADSVVFAKGIRPNDPRETQSTYQLLPQAPLLSYDYALEEQPVAAPRVVEKAPPADFGEAFSAARAEGADTFEWKGKTFTTRTKEEEDAAKPRPVQAAAAGIQPGNSVTPSYLDSLFGRGINPTKVPTVADDLLSKKAAPGSGLKPLPQTEAERRAGEARKMKTSPLMPEVSVGSKIKAAEEIAQQEGMSHPAAANPAIPLPQDFEKPQATITESDFDFEKEARQTKGKMSGAIRALDDFQAGVTGATGAALANLGRHAAPAAEGQVFETENWLTDLGRSMQDYAQKKTPNKPTYADEIVQAFGSMASMYVPGLGVARGTEVLNILAPTAAKWAGAGAMGALESAMEANDTYDRMRAKGATIADASAAADKAFLANLGMLTVTDRLGLFNDIKNYGKRVVAASASESSQEGYQSIVGDYFSQDPIDLAKAAHNASIGAIVGGGTAALTGITPGVDEVYTGPKEEDYRDLMQRELHTGQHKPAGTPPPSAPGASAPVPPAGSAAPTEPTMDLDAALAMPMTADGEPTFGAELTSTAQPGAGTAPIEPTVDLEAAQALPMTAAGEPVLGADLAGQAQNGVSTAPGEPTVDLEAAQALPMTDEGPVISGDMSGQAQPGVSTAPTEPTVDLEAAQALPMTGGEPTLDLSDSTSFATSAMPTEPTVSTMGEDTTQPGRIEPTLTENGQPLSEPPVTPQVAAVQEATARLVAAETAYREAVNNPSMSSEAVELASVAMMEAEVERDIALAMAGLDGVAASTITGGPYAESAPEMATSQQPTEQASQLQQDQEQGQPLEGTLTVQPIAQGEATSQAAEGDTGGYDEEGNLRVTFGGGMPQGGDTTIINNAAKKEQPVDNRRQEAMDKAARLTAQTGVQHIAVHDNISDTWDVTVAPNLEQAEEKENEQAVAKDQGPTPIFNASDVRAVAQLQENIGDGADITAIPSPAISLPELGEPEAPPGTRLLTPAEARAIDAIASFFGFRPTYYLSNGSGASGVFDPTQPDRVFIDAAVMLNDRVSPLTTASHEIWHGIEVRHPEIFKVMRARAMANVNDNQLGKYLRYYLTGSPLATLSDKDFATLVGAKTLGELRARSPKLYKAWTAEGSGGRTDITPRELATKEFLADMGGNRFTADPAFWSKVYRDLTTRHGPQKAATMFGKLRDGFVSMLTKVINALKRKGFTGADELVVKQLEEIRDAIKDATVDIISAGKQAVEPVEGAPLASPRRVTTTGSAGNRSRREVSPDIALSAEVLIDKLVEAANRGKKGKMWYEKSAQEVLKMFEGDVDAAEKFIRIIAITSANTEVGANMTKALKAWRQYAAGLPFKVGTGIENSALSKTLYFGMPWGGTKTNTFYINLTEALHGVDSGFSTQDLHMARFAFGKDAPTAVEYHILEEATRRAAERLGVLPRQVQAMVWVPQKAKTTIENWIALGQHKDWSPAKMRAEAMVRAVKDYADMLRERGVTTLAKTDVTRITDDVRRKMASVLAVEAVPSEFTEAGQTVAEMPAAARAQFTGRVFAAVSPADVVKSVMDRDDVDVVLMKSEGGFAPEGKPGRITPNLLVSVVSRTGKPISREEIGKVAEALGFVYTQDGVPASRYDKDTLIEAERQDNDVQAGRMDPYARTHFAGAVFTLPGNKEGKVTPAQEKDFYALIRKHLGSSSGFTRVGPADIVVGNYDALSIDDFHERAALLAAEAGLSGYTDTYMEGYYAYTNWENWDVESHTDGRGSDSPGRSATSADRLPAFAIGSPALSDGLVGWRDRAVEAANTWLADNGYAGKPLASPRRSDAPRGGRAGEARTGAGYGTPQEHSVQVNGVHYSPRWVGTLDSSFYGNGMPGAESRRLDDWSATPEQRHRIYFYVDTGAGVEPESGVGNTPHHVKLNNLYDWAADPLGFWAASRAKGGSSNDIINRVEQAIMAAGFDGLYDPDSKIGNQGVAVLLGKHRVETTELPEGAEIASAPMFSPRRGEPPKKTVKAYKLFRMDPKRPGQLFPLFVDANTPVPMGTWLDADAGELNAAGKVKSKIGALAYRPGWHAGDLPLATHIGKKSPEATAAKAPPDIRPEEHVWAEVELAADVDWQAEADKRAKRNKSGEVIRNTAHITDRLPTDGYYRYKTSPNMTGEWLIGGSMKVNRILSDAEVESINTAAKAADLPRATPLNLKKFGFSDSGKPLASPRRGGFYSQLAETVEGAKQSAMPGQQWKSWINATAQKAGVKLDEIHWSGVLDYLDMRAKDKVTREDLVDFINDKGVKVEETILKPGNGITDTDAMYVRQVNNGIFPDTYRVMYNDDVIDEFEDESDANDYLSSMVEEASDSTRTQVRYSKYVPPGGSDPDSYREILVTLPTSKMWWAQPASGAWKVFSDREEASRYAGPTGQASRIDNLDDAIDRAEKRMAAHDEIMQEFMAEGQEEKAKTYKAKRDVTQDVLTALLDARNRVSLSADFESAHWDTPNVLVHVRVDEVDTADGDHALRVVEVQSDWGQEGRKTGFINEAQRKAYRAATKAREDFKTEMQEKYKAKYGRTPDGAVWTDALTTEELDKLDDLVQAANDLEPGGRVYGRAEQQDSGDWAVRWSDGNFSGGYSQAEAERMASQGRKTPVGETPTAPFVTDTKAWIALGLKKAIQYAVGANLDTVVFTTGQQNAELYDLSKQVSEIRVSEYAGGITVSGWKDGNWLMSKHFDSYKDPGIADYVGKDLAKKIADDVGNWPVSAKDFERSYTGKDLVVGGAGMRDFYDRIVPQVANDVLKKIGGEKVRTFTLGADRSQGNYGIKENERATMGRGSFEAHVGNEKAYFFKWEDANKWVNERLAVDVLGFDITPAMREKVLAGLPLFSPRRDMAQVRKLNNTLPKLLSRAEQGKADDTFTVLHDEATKRLMAGEPIPSDARVLPMTAMPAVLQMFGAPNQIVAMDTNVLEKLRVRDVEVNGKHGHAAELKNVTAAGMNRLLRDPAMVFLTDKGEFELVSDTWGDAGPLTMVVKPNVTEKGDETGTRFAKVMTVYSRPVDGTGSVTARLKDAVRGKGDRALVYFDPARYPGVIGKKAPPTSSARVGLSPATRRRPDDISGKRDNLRALPSAPLSASEGGIEAPSTPEAVLDKIHNRNVKSWLDLVKYIGNNYGGDVAQMPLFAPRRTIADLPEEQRPVMAKMLAAAADQMKPFHAALQDIARSQVALVLMGPLKTEDSAVRKALNKYNGNAAKVNDLIRATIVVDSPDDVKAAVAAAEALGEVVESDNAWEAPEESVEGYLDAQVKVRFNGVVAEIQINTAEMIAAKDKGHLLYEKERDITGAVRRQNREPSPIEKIRAGNALRQQQDIYRPAQGPGSVKQTLSDAMGNKTQADWLNREARARGFKNITELAGTKPDVFMRLTEKWRASEDQKPGHYEAARAVPVLSRRIDAPVKQRARVLQNRRRPAALPPEETKAQAARRVTGDAMKRFEVLEQWGEKYGVSGNDVSVYSTELAMPGRIAARVQDFREKTVRDIVKKMQKAGFKPEEVSQFMHAQHAEERNKQIASINPAFPDGGSGMDTAEAKDILDKAKQLPNYSALLDVVKDLRKVVDDTKQILLDAGIINQDIVNAWEKAYKFYVPLRGGPDEGAQTGAGKGLSVSGKQKRAMGHEVRDEYIIEHIMRGYERAIHQAERNRVGEVLIKWLEAMDNPNLGTVGEPEKRAVLQPGTKTYAVLYHGAVVDAFASKRDAYDFIANESLVFGRKPEDFTIRITSGDPQVVYMARPMLGPEEVAVYRDGEMIRVQLNDELLRRAYQRLGAEQIGKVLDAARSFNNYLSMMYTGRNPEFILVNMVRDFLAAPINLSGEYGVDVAARAMAYYPKALVDMFRYQTTGNASPILEQYRKAGGSTGAAWLTDLERLAKDVGEAYDNYQGAIRMAGKGRFGKASFIAGRKLVKALTFWIEHLNAATENAMRLAAYEAVMAKTGDETEAVRAAKNATVNFNKKGEMASQLGALQLFYNPAIQGGHTIYHALTKGEHKYQAQALVALLPVLGYLMAAMGDGDDDLEAASRYEKTRNIVIPLGNGKRLDIPMPYGYSWFVNMGQYAYELQRDKDIGSFATHAALSFQDNFSPVHLFDEEGFQPSELPLSEPVKMLQRLQVNRSSFGSEIVPENKFDPGVPDSAKMFRRTAGSFYDDITSSVNEMTGGSKTQSGAVSVSPETLRFWWTSMTGGAGAFVESSITFAKLAGTEPGAIEARDIPVVRKFVKEATTAELRARYFEAMKRARAADANLRRAWKGDDTKGETIAEARGKTANEYLGMLDAQRDALNALNMDRLEIQNNDKLSIGEKRMRLKMVERDEEEIFRAVLEELPEDMTRR